MSRANTAPSLPPAMQTPLEADDAQFFLSRTGFTPAPADVARLVGMTRAQAVAEVLGNVRHEPITTWPDWLGELPPTRAERQAQAPDQRRDAQRLRNQRYDGLRAAWINEMVATPSPLTERMTLFWHGHFTSGQDKVPFPQTMAAQNALLRREALGNFGTLLHAVAKDPAMLQYLDGASNRKGRPNENFAREVMELFTLGEGHYTQRDVTEAARAMTGWTIDPDTLRFVARPEWHDAGDKTILGETGAFDGDGFLDILLKQPQAARFIAATLWREFVSDTPDAGELETVAERFRASGYEIRAALGALWSTDAFWDPRNRGVLVKSPAEFVVGTVRLFDVGYGDPQMLANTVRTLGQNLFYPPNVKGWPGGAAWINSTTLLARKQFVEQLFRATETAGMRPAAVNGSAREMATMNVGMPRGAPPKPGRGGLRFDLERWLAQYRVRPQAAAGLSTELQLQHAVLPVPPVAAIDTGSTGSAYLEALLMDPAYQLK
ncbi:DUF1800 domain-containing protein [Burkholderia stagnalis]|uniref:DUF1800 domain-containing protein n=1 Tax=Burkholderia stagnalis TaxID=1503054 RepID=A0ABX9YFN9_9BURK|nr:DUF1800 domain-containing protein [Burkholderia stagnalis]RQQ59469.1 DUF1800 domain-containing protein [Burkholderia stagnalis]RQQ68789.1 DUF1800 domain-containing protein [Burkholderia stagnalis]RQQ70211.1 DUF1800 domain-containing protein [Burkholderia stagnalis]RQQ80999.1 DUF1800 domain-containing protein [Burkholderia stagnalis]RQQ81679.1 DUF1800 domain-containing protein [Burkholderia stagnalis]